MSTIESHPPHSHGTVTEPSVTDMLPPQVVGLCAEYADVTTVMHAAEKVRDAGFKHWDVHSPFPIHGIDSAMGIKPTILPWLVLGGGLTGCFAGIFMTAWINAFELRPPWPFDWVNLQGYQFFVSGKPLWSMPAFIPVIFECTVLFSALTTVFGMILLNRLPMLYNPLFKLASFRRATSDRFFIVVDAGDKNYDQTKTLELLKSTKPLRVETVED
ncbi:MAG TPA: DUF3341 domain-containing protein [Tepidisphaeraceae bacterium]|jgi:hypothetical protein